MPKEYDPLLNSDVPSATSDDSTHDDDQEGSDDVAMPYKQSPFSCVFNFVNTSLGSGVLTLPFDLMVAGYALGIGITFTFCLLSMASYYMLIKTANYSHRFQYDAVSDKIFPKYVGIIATTASILFSCGCVISYVIVIRDNFFFFTESQTLYRNLLLWGIMVLLILPLCFLPSLESLKFNSYFIIIVIIYLAFVTVYTFFSKLSSGEAPHPTVVPINKSLSFIQAFPLTTQAFNSQYNFLNLYRELHSRKKNGPKVVNWTLLIITVIYMTIGVFGYLTFGSTTESDILKNLAEEGSILTNIANVGMILLMICHYPLPVYALRKSIEGAIFKTDAYENKKVQYLISTMIVVIASLIGTFLSSIDNVLDFTSSLAGGTLGFIIPGMFFWKLARNKHIMSQMVGGVMMIVVGIIITSLGFGMAVYKWIVKPFMK
ncbi:Amino_acid transporter [Hexamita inflata]|uniref:Putative n=1 Tax=Hexamita inflata TaxID=28002 RepID=A0AA86P1L2_9EUKA|nr:Amino acid transporter [Hexamita inflata]